MFSAQGLPLGSDTLEYAWLIDMQAGGLTGRVSVPQVCVCVWLCLNCGIACLSISKVLMKPSLQQAFIFQFLRDYFKACWDVFKVFLRLFPTAHFSCHFNVTVCLGDYSGGQHR